LAPVCRGAEGKGGRKVVPLQKKKKVRQKVFGKVKLKRAGQGGQKGEKKSSRTP